MVPKRYSRRDKDSVAWTYVLVAIRKEKGTPWYFRFLFLFFFSLIFFKTYSRKNQIGKKIYTVYIYRIRWQEKLDQTFLSLFFLSGQAKGFSVVPSTTVPPIKVFFLLFLCSFCGFCPKKSILCQTFF